eukprot:488415_1
MSECESCGSICKSIVPFRTGENHCRKCRKLICNDCLSQYKFRNQKLCINCEDEVFSNNLDNKHQLNDKQLQMYLQLIDMGFSFKLSIISSLKYSNINAAMQFILSCEETETKQNNNQTKTDKQTKKKAIEEENDYKQGDEWIFLDSNFSKMLSIDNTIIFKQGWLEKKSKYIGSWKKRWCVVNGENLLIFETTNISANITESIPLSAVTGVVSGYASNKMGHKMIFHIQANNRKHQFRAENESDQIEWIYLINKYKTNCIKILISIQCNRDNFFNEKIQLVIPYDNEVQYSIRELINNITNYLNPKHHPLKFIPQFIKQNSFIGKRLNYDDDCKELEINVTKYDANCIQDIGLCLVIDINFKHLEVEQLMVYFETIKKKYEMSDKNKKNYLQILLSVVEQIKQKLHLMKKPLNLSMLHFIFVNGFMKKHEFKSVARELLADQLSQLIENIADDELSKYIFEDANSEILSHYNKINLMKLLKKYYSDTFAIF